MSILTRRTHYEYCSVIIGLLGDSVGGAMATGFAGEGELVRGSGFFESAFGFEA